MATVLRRPLSSRQPELWSNNSASPGTSSRQTTCAISNKRPHSPNVKPNSVKKVKTAHPQSLSLTTLTGDITPSINTREARERKVQEKLRQREEREKANREFLTRYTKAFPSFVFYFDDRDGSRQRAESRVLALGARIELFFSASVTHVITNCAQPPKSEQFYSHDHGGYDKLVRDAVQLHKKIWSISKLENILSRLIPSTCASRTKTGQCSPQLNQLLQHERIHGTTSERDPRERRHDYQYFSKQSHFLLVEDIRGELATIAIMEYSLPSRAEKDRAPSYPTLYMDHRARSPFVKYDEKEARRQNRIDTTERLKEMEREKIYAMVKRQIKRHHDDGNGYLAASGNSVPITSTTTSFAQGLGSGLRLTQSLREKVARQVVTNRRLESAGINANVGQYNSESRIRKSRSMTTMRLPAREESKKPGYCEACRMKFDDFKDHVQGLRHRKFSLNENNYVDLDFLLCRLERKLLADASSAQLVSEAGEASDPLDPNNYFYHSEGS